MHNQTINYSSLVRVGEHSSEEGLDASRYIHCPATFSKGGGQSTATYCRTQQPQDLVVAHVVAHSNHKLQLLTVEYSTLPTCAALV